MIKKFEQFIKENNELKGIEIRKNRLDESTPVYIVYPFYEKFDFFKERFEEYGHAFYSSEYNIIFLDGRIMDEDWYTDNHLYVIESHEYGHKLDNHQHGKDIQSELEADYIGYHVLIKHNLSEASEILYDLFYDRYNMTIEEFEPNDFIKNIINSI